MLKLCQKKRGKATASFPFLGQKSFLNKGHSPLALTLAALNGLEVKAGDVLNAYLTAPVNEKIYTTLGPRQDSNHQRQGPHIALIFCHFTLGLGGCVGFREIAM